MAPKGQQSAEAGRGKKRVWPRISPPKKKVSAYARQFIPNMLELDWVRRHLYHRLICQRMPAIGADIQRCLTSDELLTGEANASKPLVEVIPLKNKNMKRPRQKKPQHSSGAIAGPAVDASMTCK